MNSYDGLSMHSLDCYFGVYFPCCFASGVIKTKITILGAQKQFATRVRKLFFICLRAKTTDPGNSYKTILIITILFKTAITTAFLSIFLRITRNRIYMRSRRAAWVFPLTGPHRATPKPNICWAGLQYIPRNMHTVLLCFALLWLCNRS